MQIMATDSGRAWLIALGTGLLYALLVSVVFWPLLGGAMLFAGDIAQHYLPWEHFASAELARGVLPELHRGFYCGHPLLAEGQAALFYPLTRLVYALIGHGSLIGDVRAFQIDVMVHWVIAGWGIWYAGTVLGLPWRTAFFAGLLGCFAGLYLVLPVNIPILRVAVWTGWLIGTATLYLRTNHRGAWLATTLIWALCFLAGGPQMTVLVMVGCSIYLLCSLADLGENPTPILSMAALLVTPLLGGAISAAQLIPTWQFYQQSAIRQFAGGEALSYSATWMSLSTWLLPPTWLTRMPMGHPLPAYVPPSLWLGTIGAGLSLIGLVSQQTPSRLKIWLSILLLFALGGTTPVYPLLIKVLPLLGWFRAPDRYLALAVVPLCLLAGWGLERLLSDAEAEAAPIASPMVLAGTIVLLMLLGAIGLGAWGLRLDPTTGLAEGTWAMLRAMAPDGGMALGLLALFGILLRMRSLGRLTAPTVVAVCTVLTMGQIYILKDSIPPLRTMPRAEMLSEPAVSVAIHTELAKSEALHWGRVVQVSPFSQAASLFGGMEALDLASGEVITDYLSWHHGAGEKSAQLARFRQLHPNSGTLWGLEYVGGIASLYTARMDQYLNFMDNTQLAQMFFTETRTSGTTLLDLAGGRYLLLPERTRRGFLPSVDIDGQAVAINHRAKPLAWLMEPTQLLPESPEALTGLVELRIDPGQVLVLDSLDEPRYGPAPSAILPSVSWQWLNANSIQLETEALSDSWLIVSLQAMEGWTATLNGRRVPLHRAWGTFLAVPVKPGAQRLVLTYRTPGLDAGIAISVGTLLLLGMGLLWWSPVGDAIKARLGSSQLAKAE